MLRVMIQKIWHKKWMVMCLLLGSILLIATVVSFPLYRNAAFDRMLTDEFNNYLSDKGEWPTINRIVAISKKDKGGKYIKKMEDVIYGMSDELGVTEKMNVFYYLHDKKKAKTTMKRDNMGDLSLRLGSLTDLPAHTKVLSGAMYSESGISDEGAYEVVVSQNTMVKMNLLIGEVLEFEAFKTYDGKAIKIKVVGVIEEADKTDFYWPMQVESLENVVLMEENAFRDAFLGEKAEKYTISCDFRSLFEYEDITIDNLAKIDEYSRWLTSDKSFSRVVKKQEYLDIIESFQTKQTRISATLFILQIPVLILLGAFLFMISGQMYDLERNEISVMKSRGGSSGQMFRLYLYQSVLLAVIGGAIGIPLGTVFCRILGSAQNFLEFTNTRKLNISFTEDVWMYAVIVVIVSITIMTLPALKHSRLTIVKVKQQNASRKRPLWEKLFIDVICLGISVYGYYSFSGNQDAMVQNVLQGKALDPLLYISSSLFIVGLGLLFLRLQPLFVKGVYVLGKKFWKPASYASFMENAKNGRKQQFIMLFMILTVSLGMYHATVARTILQNATDNAEYLEPVDLIVKEQWMDNSNAMSSSSATGDVKKQYMEPEFNKYSQIAGVDKYTKVVYDTKAKATVATKDKRNCTLMAIHTREFGEITYVDDDLLEKPYYEYLNELAAEPRGILVSRNFSTVHGLKVGDTLDYTDSDDNKLSGKIVDFFDYWPGYVPSEMVLNNDESVSKVDNLMIVANIGNLQKKVGVTPYEVWMSLKDGADSSGVYQWIADNGVHIKRFRDKSKELTKVAQDPLLQGTNGVLTMGFIVTIILCAVGYLIYWIMSIRSREMLFGVLRACGMHKGELFHLLINEQIFSGVLSILAAIGVGTLTSKMFVPILQTAYAASNQVLPMQLITDSQDMVRLYGVVGGVMALCLFILIMIVFKLNVTKALKLGEE